MKKILIPLLLFVVLSMSVVIFLVSASYSHVQYEKNTLSHVLSLDEGSELFGEYLGVKTKIVGRNVSRVKEVVAVYERKRLYIRPDYDAENAIYLTFTIGATYIIAENDALNDSVFVLYTYKDKNLYYSITGYRSFHWAMRAISPQGIGNANILVEDASSTD